MYYIELVWNREFDWSRYGTVYTSVDQAVNTARKLMLAGDGASVKEARIVDNIGNVVVPNVSC